MLLTPRAPSTAVEGAWWLRQAREELCEAVGAGLRLRHLSGPDVRGRALQAVAGIVEQRGQGKSLCRRYSLVACLVEAAVRIPDVGFDVTYVVDVVSEAHLQPAGELDLFGLVQELREGAARARCASKQYQSPVFMCST